MPHLFTVDALRTLAAIAVLLWHYQHFYYVKAEAGMPPAMREQQPLYDWLSFFYLNGHFGVELFWFISGFVFAHVYFRQQGIDPLDFARKRFARIYPLHVATLLLVAGLQALSTRITGNWQIYAHNDPYHFILNLFMASRWGLHAGHSFNAPIWSVSVEVLTYVSFVALFPVVARSPLTTARIGFACWLIGAGIFRVSILACAGYFYLGATLWHLLHAPRFADSTWSRHVVWIALLAICATVAIGLRGKLETVVFCAALVGLAARADRLWRSPPSALKHFGDLSYGIYLVHVPIQIVALIVFNSGRASRDVLAEPWFLAAFIGTVMATAAIVHVTFEKPVRRRIRKMDLDRLRSLAEHRLRPGRGTATQERNRRRAPP